MSPPHSLHCALSDAVASGVFIDTKFYLFSRRKLSGEVFRPRPLFANSQTLKSVQYFDDLLSGGFSEGVTKNLDYEPPEDSDLVEDYDYVSDSDLEDDDEAAESATETQDPPVGKRNLNVTAGNRSELSHQGRVVALRGVSYLTFQAIVMYLYTDEIDFAPFGSKANRELRIPELVSGEADTIPRPSPKSIYRIADMYDIPKLKGLAFESIRSGIKSCDAVEETFSKFTSRYPEIADLHVGNLASVLLSPNSQDIQERLNQKLRSFANGEIPHAADAFSALFGILARHRPSDIPPDADKAKIQAESKCSWVIGGNREAPPHRKFMNIALIRSMHHGSFLDMKYRVRQKQAGADKFTTIYLSSSIFCRVRSELDALAHTHNADVGEDEVDSDSDYEEEPTTGSTEARADGSTQKGDSHKILPGAFTTWKALFLCLCFNEITFGPLKSQETSSASSSSASSSATKSAGETLACSPKSFYRLAQPLGLNPLADLAFRDISGKLTSGNIVVELFSRFTARNDKLIEKQSLLLTSTLKTPQTTVAFQQHVLEMANGTLSHRYDALKLTFGNVVDAIKQEHKRIVDEQKARNEAEEAEKRVAVEAEKRAAVAVTKLMARPTLKCQRNSCREVSTKDVQHGNRCSCGYSFACSGCGRAWGGTDTCGGCNKEFR